MDIKLSREGLTKTGVVLLLLSGLVFHDFFALKYVKLGVITITYLRVILVVTIPLLLFLYKVRIRKNDILAYILLIFMAYGLTRIEGNLKEAFSLYCPLIAFFFLYFSVFNKKTLDKCIDFMSLLFMFFCIVGIIEIITEYHFVDTRFDLLEEKKRVACGMYYNENDFSAYLTVSLLFLLSSKYKNWIKFIFSIIALTIVVINNSIICFLGIMSFFLISFVIRKKTNRFFRFIVFLVLGLIFLNPAITIINSSSIWWRSYMYTYGFKNVISHMWFGTGIGKYGEGMLSVGFNQSQHGVSVDPHNLFFELAGVFGIIWAILLIILLLKLLFHYFKIAYKNKNIYYFGLVYIIPFIGLSSSSCMEKNYIYLALLIPLIHYKFYKNRFSIINDYSLEEDFSNLSDCVCSNN